MSTAVGKWEVFAEDRGLTAGPFREAKGEGGTIKDTLIRSAVVTSMQIDTKSVQK
jgi:hypothetical protein